MPSRIPIDHQIIRDGPPRASTPRRRIRDDRVTQERPAQRPTEDRVTSQRQARPARSAARQRTQPRAFVLPTVRQMASLVAPNIVATVSVLAALAVSAQTGNSVLFIVPLVIPGLILGALHGTAVGYRWREAAAINLAVMLILFPLLIIRQNTVRVPYLDVAHGTAFAAVLSTAAVLVALVGLAVVVAWVSREAPESSAMLFMPAALLVPLLTSATEFAHLQSALLVAGMIFVLSAVLTLLASVMPPAYIVFVAPLAVALEVLFVTLVRQDRIFPVGANEAGMTLFAAVVVSTLAIVVVLPSLSGWMNRVERYRTLLRTTS